MFALAYLVSRWIPQWGAFGIVAFLNLAVGGALTASGARKLARRKLALPVTNQEIRRDKEWIASLKSANGPGREPALPETPSAQRSGQEASPQ